MFVKLLSFHSLFRWLVLLGLVVCIGRGIRGWLKKRDFSRRDLSWAYFLLGSSLIQFVLGLTLYFKSPLVAYFLKNVRQAIGQRDFRFFGLEHITAMSLGILLILVGVIRIRKRGNSQKRYKRMLFWFGLAFILIFFSIPWSFSPFTSRPNFRWF